VKPLETVRFQGFFMSIFVSTRKEGGKDALLGARRDGAFERVFLWKIQRFLKKETDMITERAKEMEDVFLGEGKGKVYSMVIGSAEKELIEKVLKRTFGNQSIAAKILGINRNTLRTKIKKLNVDVGRFRI
jgi:DNA-binding protein Fis